ncbi:hydrolase [Vibrio sinensis]|uniref:Hydrolase n=1 Tax=Vibrio sinensis TaxID=2302434 RepID=A0A3A6QCR6_9VIBR|nr:hydrolase [Vibrio sinensis]RJX69519.1 hydrolase [Vibrio sinensis]
MLDRSKTGLIVVDIQGKLARLVHDSDALITNCSNLIQGFQTLGLPIIVLEQNPERLGATVDELRPLLADITPIPKLTFSGCLEPKFVDALNAENVDTWLICGIETHICVYQTAMGLLDLGYKVELLGDCVSSRTQENKQLGINKLMTHGVEISGVEMALYELLQDCKAPEFKRILTLIR